MGWCRNRIEGVLYLKAKYIMFFKSRDGYGDNYAVEDAYNIIKNYNLDSVKFLFWFIKNNNTLNKSEFIKKFLKIGDIYGIE